MEVFTGYPNQSSDSVSHRNRKMGASRGRSEKNAIRVCGDWSEQLSSKGKIYFYNCITEVSQWQKPPEWKLPDMDPEELLRRLAHRESQPEAKNLKRTLLSTAYHVKRGIDDRRCSPKRNKCNEGTTKFNHSDNAPSNHRLSEGHSPITITNSFTKQVSDQPLKTRSNLHTSRPLPADDMEISPNSSPLSNSSSANANLSPDFPKCSRIDNQDHNSKLFRQSSSHETSSGTLRQLVDAIRASIGGLLDCSSTSIESSTDSETKLSRQTLNPRLQCNSDFITNNVTHTSDYNHYGEIHMSAHSSNNRNQFNHGDCSTTKSHGDKRDINQQTTAMPGLVSTLTTLVSLIGHSKCPDIQNSSNPVTATTVLRSDSSQGSILPAPMNNVYSDIHSPSTPMEQKFTRCRVASQELSYSQPHHSAIDDGPTRQPDLLQPDFASTFIEAETTPTKSCTENCHPFKKSFRSTIAEKSLAVSDGLSKRSPIDPADTYDQMSDFVGFANRSAVDGVEDPGIRSIFESFDGFDRPLSNHVNRHRVPYTPKRLNGVCDSPVHSLLNTHSPATKTGSKELPLLDNYATTESPSKAFPNEAPSFPPGDTSSFSSKMKDERSPDITSEDEGISSAVRFMSSPSIQMLIDVSTISRFLDKSVERLEQEGQHEARKFENLQSVLYGELSAESKKLHALVRISEAKLAIHREKQSALQDLMDAIETRKILPNLSFADDVL